MASIGTLRTAAQRPHQATGATLKYILQYIIYTHHPHTVIITMPQTYDKPIHGYVHVHLMYKYEIPSLSPYSRPT